MNISARGLLIYPPDISGAGGGQQSDTDITRVGGCFGNLGSTLYPIQIDRGWVGGQEDFQKEGFVS